MHVKGLRTSHGQQEVLSTLAIFILCVLKRFEEECMGRGD